MATCERCWAMSRARSIETGEDQVEEYRRLLRINDCTPEQQAGPDAGECPKCEARTVHQHTHQCIACGWEKEEAE